MALCLLIFVRDAIAATTATACGNVLTAANTAVIIRPLAGVFPDELAVGKLALLFRVISHFDSHGCRCDKLHDYWCLSRGCIDTCGSGGILLRSLQLSQLLLLLLDERGLLGHQIVLLEQKRGVLLLIVITWLDRHLDLRLPLSLLLCHLTICFSIYFYN